MAAEAAPLPVLAEDFERLWGHLPVTGQVQLLGWPPLPPQQLRVWRALQRAWAPVLRLQAPALARWQAAAPKTAAETEAEVRPSSTAACT